MIDVYRIRVITTIPELNTDDINGNLVLNPAGTYNIKIQAVGAAEKEIPTIVYSETTIVDY